jgi:hypothetical protein
MNHETEEFGSFIFSNNRMTCSRFHPSLFLILLMVSSALSSWNATSSAVSRE